MTHPSVWGSACKFWWAFCLQAPHVLGAAGLQAFQTSANTPSLRLGWERVDSAQPEIILLLLQTVSSCDPSRGLTMLFSILLVPFVFMILILGLTPHFYGECALFKASLCSQLISQHLSLLSLMLHALAEPAPRLLFVILHEKPSGQLHCLGMPLMMRAAKRCTCSFVHIWVPACCRGDDTCINRT